ncbi:MAG: hypothetical protein R2827_05475 [Bdellovibrionales bacterium]
MKVFLVFLSLAITIATLGQGCLGPIGVGITVVGTIAASAGNGEGYDGKLVVVENSSDGFTCEGKQRPERILFTTYFGPLPITKDSIDKNTKWSLIVNTPEKCSEIGDVAAVVEGLSYDPVSSSLEYENQIYTRTFNEGYTYRVTGGDPLPDSGDASPGDRVCDNGQGQCTLRAAIEEANAEKNNVPILIQLPKGVYTIHRDIEPLSHPITVAGQSRDQTIIQASGENYGLFNIASGHVVFRNLTIKNFSRQGPGGAISTYNDISVERKLLEVSNCRFENNQTTTNNDSVELSPRITTR